MESILADQWNAVSLVSLVFFFAAHFLRNVQFFWSYVFSNIYPINRGVPSKTITIFAQSKQYEH